ncbi:hypothetical protein TRSC58_01422 [Trypanosoma rangeli SC58]|uniref:N-acetyltransferase domain-containing protein n=1 Tax=Trypanosoma rangeli SC58 TaxID=429131 RepID=A0A061J5X7_TRYRA|nr:hypothetical protein TRSC58_01422 [Trypanosoma rangeli SC58]
MNNARVLVSGSRLRLVPYLAHHVPRYYEWMGDSELMQCTASERLTLEEEYDNQRDWLHAEDKLTFILLAPLSMVVEKAPRGVIGDAVLGKCTTVKGSMDAADVGAGGTSGGNEILRVEDAGAEALQDGIGPEVSGVRTPSATACSTHAGDTCSLVCVDCGVEGSNSETYVMVGDCNLFRLSSNDVEQVEQVERDEVGAVPSDAHGRWFEVAVMVAERAFRRQGFGEEAVRLLISYAIDKLDASCFIAKILNTNTPSIRLFTEKLGFTLLKEVPVFKELHFVKCFTSAAERVAWRSAVAYAVGEYDVTTEESIRVLHFVPDTAECRRDEAE